MSTWLAALIAVVAITATYVVCIRPMRQGTCGTAAHHRQSDAERAREIAELREELRILHAEDAFRHGKRIDPRGNPPTTSS